MLAWRGITAFRLLEMEAGGRGPEVDSYLRWAAAERLTVVRVLAMAQHLFELPPERGLGALDALLARAARHGLFVEVVALADTAAYPIDAAAQVRRVGEISARHANAIMEIANEPYHPTQRPEIHDPKYLARLRSEIPAGVPVALGAGDYPTMHADGDYVTVHFPRSADRAGWGWVAALRDGIDIIRQVRKPVVDDEPIGAGERAEPGRRDADPERFRAAAIANRLTGVGATFHYEGGLQARRPAGNALACFRGWQEAWTLIPGDGRVEPFDAGPAAPVAGIRGDHAAVFLGSRGDMAWLLIAGAGAGAVVDWQDGWVVTVRREWPASRFYGARRVSARTSGRK